MPKFFVITKRQLSLTAAVVIALIAVWLYFSANEDGSEMPVIASPAKERVIHMVTGEFKGKMEDGTEIEAYRWDPGTIFVNKGETVNLVIRGVSGRSHPFIIEGTDIKGEVKQGKETVVKFTPKNEGVYRLICLTHPDASRNGPMIAYIVVD